LQELYPAAFYSMNTLGVFLHMLRQGWRLPQKAK